MYKRVILWALAGWAVFGIMGATASVSAQAPPEHVAAGFLMPGIFGLMVGGMVGLGRGFKADQRELGRFLLTVIGGTVLVGTVFVQLVNGLDWPGWIAPAAAAVGSFAGLALSLHQFRKPLSHWEGALMLAAALVLGYQSFGPLIVPILVISALAIRHHIQKNQR